MLRKFAGKAPSGTFTRPQLLFNAAPFCCFIGVVLWFQGIDFYHRHFFDAGAIVLADNLMRIVFVAILSWLIYAPGASILALITTRSDRAALPPSERALLGFGIGVGVWHVAMLFLGVFGLYYRVVMDGLCLIVLAASARHFGSVAVAAWRGLSLYFAELRAGRVALQTIGAFLIALAAFWLLLVRGLYPGGNIDYYNHYFYYYLDVLKHHKLVPNERLGSLLLFERQRSRLLGMLLTDPEAPALTTFACVIFAAVAMAALAARLAGRSLWPAAGATLFLLFYLASLSWGGGGEF